MRSAERMFQGRARLVTVALRIKPRLAGLVAMCAATGIYNRAAVGGVYCVVAVDVFVVVVLRRSRSKIVPG